jgi:secreted Zn-dependent insulinase-like peptidase
MSNQIASDIYEYDVPALQAEGAPKSQRKTSKAVKPKTSKTEAVLSLLRHKNGASLVDLQSVTGWQAHSVRGFLSGTVKKKLNLALSCQLTAKGERRYHIAKA